MCLTVIKVPVGISLISENVRVELDVVQFVETESRTEDCLSGKNISFKTSIVSLSHIIFVRVYILLKYHLI